MVLHILNIKKYIINKFKFIYKLNLFINKLKINQKISKYYYDFNLYYLRILNVALNYSLKKQLIKFFKFNI